MLEIAQFMSLTPANPLTPDILKLRIASQFAPYSQRRQLERLCDTLATSGQWPALPTQRGASRGGWPSQSQQSLASLLVAASAAGHPADIVLATLERRTRMRATRYEMTSALLYPTLLLLISLVITSIVGMVLMSYADLKNIANESFSRVSYDFFDAALGGLVIVVYLLVLAGLIQVLAASSVRLKLWSSLPLIGRPYRWMMLSDLLTRLSIFAAYRPELDRALALVADSYGSEAQGAIAAHVAEHVRLGMSLQLALHQTILSDQPTGMALTLIELDPVHFRDSLARASELLEDMTQQLCERIQLIYPTMILLLVASIVWGAWASYIEVFRYMLMSFL